MRTRFFGPTLSPLPFAPSFIGALLFALCPFAEAQPETKIFRIGYLDAAPSGSAPLMEAFRQSMAKLGWVEGKNIVIEHRFLDGKRDLELAEELVRAKVDVIVAAGGASPARAAREATRTIPIVMTTASDPVAQGFVASLARPGGNVTGLSTFAPELGGKRLELLKEMVPKLSRVAVVGISRRQAHDPEMKELEVAARALGVQLQQVDLRGPNDLEKAFSAMTKNRAEALIGLQTRNIINLRKRIGELAVNSRLPAVSFEGRFAEAGWLMSYGPDFADLYRRAATHVDKILKGRKPADLPVERPTKFELIINLKTAKQIGLTIPPNVLARADKVIR
jgi:putative tryptophan/tyrosine transport system substrate-binding protein